MPMPDATATQEKYWMASGLAAAPAANTADVKTMTKNTETPETLQILFIQSSIKNYSQVIARIPS
jgi:hypothetical protein